MKEVHIDDLTDEEKTSKMNMNRNYLDVQLIRLIMPSQRDQKVTLYTTINRNGKKVLVSRECLLDVFSFVG